MHVRWPCESGSRLPLVASPPAGCCSPTDLDQRRQRCSSLASQSNSRTAVTRKRSNHPRASRRSNGSKSNERVLARLGDLFECVTCWKNLFGHISACTATLTGDGRILQRVLLLTDRRGCCVVDALVHLLTDDVRQLVEDLLHVDVVLGAGLEELEACDGGRGEVKPIKGSSCGDVRLCSHRALWPLFGRLLSGPVCRLPSPACCPPAPPERCPTSTS